MHPLVRNLYKRVLHVGHDYPTGMDHVKKVWKKALRNPKNCPSCYTSHGNVQLNDKSCQEELMFAIHRGRTMVQEMIGVIQLKKYRAMRARYDESDPADTLERAMEKLENKQNVENGS